MFSSSSLFQTNILDCNTKYHSISVFQTLSLWLHCARLAIIPSYIIAQLLCLFCLDDVAFMGGCWGGQTDVEGGPSPLTGGGGGGGE